MYLELTKIIQAPVHKLISASLLCAACDSIISYQPVDGSWIISDDVIV